MTLGAITEAFGPRAYGVLLLLAAMVGFLPSPVGAGTLAGALGLVVGLQMLAGRAQPWLPRWLSERSIERRAIGGFLARRGTWLARLERLASPRLVELFVPPWMRLSGLVVAIHSVVIALPVPLTNYPLSAMLLLVAIALIEDDGRLLLAGFALMLGAALTLSILSGGLLALVAEIVG